MTQAEEERRTFHILDLLRGIAALAVVARHLRGTLFDWLPGSHLAVDLFFIMSGLVITHAYEGRLTSGSVGIVGFMRLRVIRLYPLYILGTLAMLSMLGSRAILGHGDATSPTLLLIPLLFGALFLPPPPRLSFDSLNAFPLNFPAWSLFWELAANLLYAAIARFLRWPLLLLIIAIGALLVIWSARAFGDLDTGAATVSFVAGLARVTFGFFAGVAIERLRRAGRLPKFFLPVWASAGILLAIFMLRSAGHAPVYDCMMALIAFPLLVGLSLGQPPRWAFGLCAKAGLASYAIYVLQAPVVRHFAFRHDGIPFELAILAALVLIALAVDRFYDTPVRSWLARRLLKPGRR